MPEGDTVHKVAAYLDAHLTGKTVTEARLRGRGDPALAGRRVSGVHARGKFLDIRLDDGSVLRSHLGMYGSWHRYTEGEPWRKPARQAGLELSFAGDVYVCFNPKSVEWLRSDSIPDRTFRSRLGPDVLAEDFDATRSTRRARDLLEEGGPLVDVLLDQRVASGIGNVYKSELLFLHGLPPRTPLGSLDDEALAAVFIGARNLLGANLGGGPRVTRPGGQGAGRLWVYGRRGRPCHRCGTPIRSEPLGAHRRSTYWCPKCQAAPAPAGGEPGIL